MMQRKKIAKYLTLFFVVLFSGCASLDHRDRIEMFESTAFKYENAIRWSDYELADSFRISDRSEKTSQNFEYLRDYRVSSYDIRSRKLTKDLKEVIQTVEIKYYNVNTLIEKTVMLTELWKFREGSNRWILESGFPDLR